MPVSSPSSARKRKPSAAKEDEAAAKVDEAGKDGHAVSEQKKASCVVDVDETAIAAALHEDPAKALSDGQETDEDDDVMILKAAANEDKDGDWLAEERKLAAENKKKEDKERQKQSKLSKSAKVEVLNNLLQKAAAYTAFLRSRMQEGNDSPAAGAGASKGAKAKAGKDEKDPRQPKLLSGAVMRKYQVEGMIWIRSLYENGLNGILADEMGLGKTMQVIAFFAHLYGMGVNGPFLVVSPLSTVPNWQREFKRFAPTIETVLYHGSKEERKAIREQHGFERRTKPDKSKVPDSHSHACALYMHYPILLTTGSISPQISFIRLQAMVCQAYMIWLVTADESSP